MDFWETLSGLMNCKETLEQYYLLKWNVDVTIEGLARHAIRWAAKELCGDNEPLFDTMTAAVLGGC